MLKPFFAALVVRQDYALTALRMGFSIVLLRHGFAKFFGGDFAIPFFEQVGIPWPWISGPFVSFLEFFGGLSLLFGLFTRYLGVLFCIQFLVAVWVVWIGPERSFAFGRFYTFGQAELPLLMALCSAVLAAYGSGAWAMDRVYKRLDP